MGAYKFVSDFLATAAHSISLDKLPFDDEEFDYVNIKRIGRAVPEDKVHTYYTMLH